MRARVAVHTAADLRANTNTVTDLDVLDVLSNLCCVSEISPSVRTGHRANNLVTRDHLGHLERAPVC